MKRNKLELEIIKGKAQKGKFERFKIILKNKETALTELIINNKIQFSNLKYKIVITQLEEIKKIVRDNYIQEIYPHQSDIIKYLSYTPNDFYLDIKDLNELYVYNIKAFLVEKIPNTFIENEILNSNIIKVNILYGLVDRKLINRLYKDRYTPKGFLSKSEKDNLKSLSNEVQFQELDGVLNQDDIKTFTYEGRTYDNISQFVNSKLKASKLMDERRKKKVLFSTHTDMFFDSKINLKNNNNEKNNPFMKNEWFMGPIYSYDYNYDKFV